MLEQTSTAPAQRFGAAAQNVAMLLVFLLPILFLPASWMPFAYTKVVLVALAAFVPLIMWTRDKFKEGSLMYPNSHVLWLVLLLPVAYLVSALLSGDMSNSIIGAGYENGTLLFMLLLVALFVGVSVIFTSVSAVAKMLFAIVSSFGVLAFVQVARLVFGAGNVLPSVFSADPTATLIGSWNDLAVFSGLMVITSIVALIYAPRTKLMRALMYVNLATALFLLVVVNLKVVWVMLALLSLVLFVYFMATKRVDGDYDNVEKEGVFKMSATVGVFAISILFIFAGSFLGSKVSSLLNIQNVDVRPSWDGTTEVMMSTYGDNALFGSGPNTFSTAWVQNKPVGVNDTAFWNIDFNSGIGVVPTAFVTVGLVGGVLWLLMIASVIYLAFRVLWARMPNDTTRFVVFTTVGSALYLLLMLIMYVPQTVMLAITFVVVGLFLAVARNVNVVRTRKISMNDGQAISFVLIFVFTAIAVVAVSLSVITIQRVSVATLLERSVRAAQSDDLTRALKLAKRAEAFTLGGVFGNDDRVYSVLSQIGMVNLREVVQGDVDAKDFQANLRVAVESVVVPAQAAVDANPENYNNHVFLGGVYEQISGLNVEGAYEAALAAYSKAIELNPNNPSIHLMMARAAFTTEKLADAEAYANKAIEIKRNYADAYYLLSQIAIKNSNTKAAIETTEAAVLLTPNNAGLLFQLGVLQYSEGEYTKSAAIFSRAVSLNPKYANALYYLGLSHAQLGNKDLALQALGLVQELNPDNEEIKQLIVAIEAGNLESQVQEEGTSATTPVSE